MTTALRTAVLIIRHGESVWNAAGRWQGQADLPLSELGRLQARKAATSLPPFGAIAASTLERARHTAEIISEETRVGPVVVEGRLVERDAGEFSGLTRGEIDIQYPGYLSEGRWPAGWESDQRLAARVRAGLDAVVRGALVETLVVVAHGGVIYSLENQLGAPHERISNLGGRWFDWIDGTLTLGARQVLLEDDLQTVPDQI